MRSPIRSIFGSANLKKCQFEIETGRGCLMAKYFQMMLTRNYKKLSKIRH